MDSIAGATTEPELSGGLEKQGYNTSKALLLSSFMRQLTNLFGKEKILIVFSNQLRQNLGIMFGEKYVSSGGKAIPYHASIRVRLAATAKIKKTIDGVEKIVGIEIEARVIKSKLGAPHKKTRFKMYFDSGIDNMESFLGELKNYKIISGKSEYEFNDGETVHTFTLSDLRKMFKEKSEVYQKMYNLLVSKIIEPYNFQKTENEGSEEILVETGSDSDD